MEGISNKGRVCVTGGAGFLGSWLVKRLLEDGYSVNTTARIDPDFGRDLSYLTNLAGASERLRIFNADLEKPQSFVAAIEGCIGVFHTAHPPDLAGKLGLQEAIKRITTGLKGILDACAGSKTVKRVVYTSSIPVVNRYKSDVISTIDENHWTDIEFVRSLGELEGSGQEIKALEERFAIDYSEKLGLDLVLVLPTFITGPFICPQLPHTVHLSMALILGNKEHYRYLMSSSFVHVDDVARAHIHLFEYPEAKGRYICSAVDFTTDELCEFISTRYPEYHMPTPDLWKDLIPVKLSGYSTKKLLETRFKYENGLEKMFDGAIKCCKDKGLLCLP